MALSSIAKKLALARIGVSYNTNLNFFETGFEGINIKEIDFWNKLQTIVGENIGIQHLVGAKLIFRKLNGDEKIYDIIMIVGWYLSKKKAWVVFYNTSDNRMELWNEFTYNNPFRNGNKVSINKIYDFGQSEDTGNLYFLTETFENNPQIFGDINNPPEHIFQVILLNGNENGKQFLTLVSCINPNNYLPEEKLELEINKIVELTNVDETHNLEMSKALHRVDEIEDNKYLVAIWNKSSDVEFGACNIWPVNYDDSVNETEVGYNVPSSGNPYRGKKSKGTPVQAHSRFSLKVSPHPNWINPISTFNLKGFSIGETSDGFVWLAKQIDDFESFLFLDGSENRFAAYQKYYKEFITVKSLPPGYVKLIPNPGSKSIIEGGFSSSTSKTVDYSYSSFDYENNQQYRGYNFTGSSLSEHGFSTSELSGYIDDTYIGDVHYEEVYNTYLGVVMYDRRVDSGGLVYHDVTKTKRVSSLFAWECKTLFEAVIHATDEQLAKEEDVFIDMEVEFKHDEYGENGDPRAWSSSGFDDFVYDNSTYNGTYTKHFTIKCNLSTPSSGFIELDKENGNGAVYFGDLNKKVHQIFHKKRLSYDVQFKVIDNTKSLLSLKINYIIPQSMTVTETLSKGRFRANSSSFYAGWEKLNVKFTLKKLYWRPTVNYIKNIFKDDSDGSNAKVPILLNLPIGSNDKTFTFPNFLFDPIIKTANSIKILSYKNNFLTLNEWTLSKPSQSSTQPSTWNKAYSFYNTPHTDLKDAQLLGHDEDFKILLISNLGLLYFSKNKLQRIAYSLNNNFFNLYLSENHLLSSWNIFADKVRIFQSVDEPKELSLNFEYDYNNKPLTVNRIKAITNDIVINASDVDLFNYGNSVTIYSNLRNDFFYDYNSIGEIQFLGTQGIPIFENIINYQKEVFNEFVYNYNYNVELKGINFNFSNDAERTINDKIFKETWNNNVWKLSDGAIIETVTAVINEEQSEVIIDTSIFPVDTNVSLLLNDKLIGTFKNKSSIKIYWRE